ncbi:MAG TPA: Zn-ribbon domain-containing OB-fold protein [Candidatus Binataceae bacterium]|nr:Zn-ribbon domain-containing OB-fold protein [Candidatus Binataceae bacterium]
MPDISKPVPAVTPDLKEFFAGAREGRLMVQKCAECGQLRFPAREFCSNCWSKRAAWTPVSGRGTIYSFNVMHQVYHPGFAAEIPYAVVVVELEEGCRMLSNLAGVPPHQIRCGMPVEVIFEKLTEEVSLPKFRLRGDAAQGGTR